MSVLHEDLFGIDRERAHEKIVDKNKNQNDDHRTDVQSPHFVGRNILAYRFEHRLSQVIKDHGDLIKGRNSDPGQDDAE
jgi:hypothetical protein